MGRQFTTAIRSSQVFASRFKRWKTGRWSAREDSSSRFLVETWNKLKGLYCMSQHLKQNFISSL